MFSGLDLASRAPRQFMYRPPMAQFDFILLLGTPTLFLILFFIHTRSVCLCADCLFLVMFMVLFGYSDVPAMRDVFYVYELYFLTFGHVSPA